MPARGGRHEDHDYQQNGQALKQAEDALLERNFVFALKLAEKGYLHVLLNTGLDHLLFLLQPEHKESWKALETIILSIPLILAASISSPPDPR
jgi:hypothetical protein